MQLLLFSALVIVLMAVAIEDFKSRAVHVVWFPALFLLAIAYALQFINATALLDYLLISFVFLALQGLLLMSYFILKHKQWIDITQSYLGWGDILFIAAVLPLFNPLVFVLFYLGSLLVTIVFVLIYRWVVEKMVFIPLAGLQSICLLAIVFYHQFIHSVLFNEPELSLLF
jgi:hypothetical protein